MQATEPTEVERVEDWREHQLLAAGYPADDAITLSRRQDVDVHVAVRLVAQGCPLDVALRIVR